MCHRIVLIDHYDSFTRNVIDWLDPGDGRLAVTLIPFDDADAVRRVGLEPYPLVLSPGPKRPEDAPETLALVAKLLGKVPILGICLGHQILALHAGARVVRAAAPFHGSTRAMSLAPFPSHLFRDVPPVFHAAVYNSLTVDPASLPADWRIVATSGDDEVQALAWEPPQAAPAYGVQFHPESYLSEMATPLRSNWISILDSYASSLAPL